MQQDAQSAIFIGLLVLGTIMTIVVIAAMWWFIRLAQRDERAKREAKIAKSQPPGPAAPG